MQRCSYLVNNVSNVNEISLEPAKKNQKKSHSSYRINVLHCGAGRVQRSLSSVYSYFQSLNFISGVEED